MRIVYFGSPQSAVLPLQALHDAGHEIVLVVTGPDKRRGRGARTSPTPVKQAAQRLGLPVTSDMDDSLTVGAELGVVVAFGRIIPTRILEAFPLVNIHFSLLPRWRGAAPVERAILAGDTSTGVCLMEVSEGLDTGGIFRRAETDIAPGDTTASLTERLTLLGAELLVDALAEGLGQPVAQGESGITYAEKVTPADREVGPAMTVREFVGRVRIGGAWTTFRGRRLKIVEVGVPLDSATHRGSLVEPGTFLDDTVVALNDGFVTLVTVQPEGRSVMAAADWARGARPVGERIGS